MGEIKNRNAKDKIENQNADARVKRLMGEWKNDFLQKVDTQESDGWDDRILCLDGNCIGVIDLSTNRCKECGRYWSPEEYKK